jgi:hypothetical protein
MYLLAKKILNEYQDINDTLPSLNRGGCGIFAEKLYDLYLRLGYKPIIILITDSLEGMKMRLESDNQYYASIIHIVIKVEDYYIDSNTVSKDRNDIGFTYGEICLDLTIDKLREWNSTASLWNRCFDRDDIGYISEKIENIYKKFGEMKN